MSCRNRAVSPLRSPLRQISESTISELGPGGLSVTGAGSVTINHTVFGYLATGALELSARGGVALLHSRLQSAAPAPLWRVRGGNATQLENVTFHQPAAAALVVLDRPTGDEQLSQLRFRCSGSGPLSAGWTAAAAAGRQTVPEGLRRYLQRAEAAAECEPATATPAAAGVDGAHTGAAASPSTAAGSRMFSNAGQVGLEILILTLAAALVTAAVKIALLARQRRRSRRLEITDTQILVDAGEAHGES